MLPWLRGCKNLWCILKRLFSALDLNFTVIPVSQGTLEQDLDLCKMQNVWYKPLQLLDQSPFLRRALLSLDFLSQSSSWDRAKSICELLELLLWLWLFCLKVAVKACKGSCNPLSLSETSVCHSLYNSFGLGWFKSLFLMVIYKKFGSAVEVCSIFSSSHLDCS